MPDEQQMDPAMPMSHQKNTWTILGVLFLILFILSALFNAYLFMQWSASQDQIDDLDEQIGMMDDEEADGMMEEGEEEMMEDDDISTRVEEGEFESFRFVSSAGNTANGVAEVEGYYFTVQMPTTLDGSGPTITCDAFIVTDGPDWVLDAYSSETAIHFDRTFIIEGQSGRAWFTNEDIMDSTEDNPTRAIFRIGTAVEGDLVGCFDTVQLIGLLPSA